MTGLIHGTIHGRNSPHNHLVVFADLSIVHIIFRNIEDFLPVNTSSLRYIDT